jgi:S1-C subfamily serine protease
METLPDHDVTLEQCVEYGQQVKEREVKDRKTGKRVKKKYCEMFLLETATTANTDRGASGSPLLNADGEVIGVVNMVFGEVAWSYAVPLAHLKRFLNSE